MEKHLEDVKLELMEIKLTLTVNYKKLALLLHKIHRIEKKIKKIKNWILKIWLMIKILLLKKDEKIIKKSIKEKEAKFKLMTKDMSEMLDQLNE